LAPLKWFFSSNFSKHAMHTNTPTHFCLSTHDYNFFYHPLTKEW
jgi:hypothetical protein